MTSTSSQVLAAGVVGYLLGTFPTADLVSTAATKGTVDLRATGSGNPGAANAAAVLGTKWGLVVLVGDLGKGALAGVIGRVIGGPNGGYAAATTSIAGHIVPIWKKGRGGKGVATSAGACLAVFPAYFPLDLGVALLGAWASKRATPATYAATATWVVSSVVWTLADWPNAWGPPPGRGLIGFAVVGGAMIVVKFAVTEKAKQGALGRRR